MFRHQVVTVSLLGNMAIVAVRFIKIFTTIGNVFNLVPVWSGVNVAGVPLHCLNKDVGTEKDESNMKQIHKDVVESAYKIIKLKGYTSTAIGFTINHLVKQILGNKQTVKSISTMVKVCNISSFLYELVLHRIVLGRTRY